MKRSETHPQFLSRISFRSNQLAYLEVRSLRKTPKANRLPAPPNETRRTQENAGGG